MKEILFGQKKKSTEETTNILENFMAIQRANLKSSTPLKINRNSQPRLGSPLMPHSNLTVNKIIINFATASICMQ